MPVAGMRRTRRVFGVVKSGDGARILRSGRKLWSDPVQDKLKKSNSNSDKDEWYKLLDEDDRRKVETSWCGQVEVKKAEVPQEVTSVGFGKGFERKIVKVYERKRKRFDWNEKADKVSNSAGFGKGCGGVDRMFGNHYVRRRRRNKSIVESGVGGECKPGLIIGCNGYIAVGWLARLLNSILAYVMKGGIKLGELRLFLSSDSIGSAFSSHEVHILQESSDINGSGFCKIFGATKFAPLFSVNFAAIPACFMYIHSSMLLHSEILLFAYLEYGSGKFDDEALDGCGESIFCITSGDQILENKAKSTISSLPARNTVPRAAEGRRVARHPMRLRNSFSSSNFKGKRSSPRYMRRKCNSLRGSFHKSDSFDTDSVFRRTYNEAKLIDSSSSDLSRKRSCESHPFGLSEELNSSPLGWRISDPLTLPFSRKRAKRAGQDECGRNTEEVKVTSLLTNDITDSTSCAANILVIDHDSCHRQVGASVTLEQSSSRWLIIVKKDGLAKYSHYPDPVMKPCTFNRVTRAIIWTVNDSLKLEFPTREDWYIFKELYKVASLRNLQAPADKLIPVPGVHTVSDYEDTVATYSRPEAYIKLDGNELSRLLANKSATYDLDSEDEEWLAKYNEEILLNNESNQSLSADTFELMIDAIEKAFFLNSSDNLDARAILDVYPDLGHEGDIQVMYEYWVKKRKQKCPTLVRVLQAHKPRKALNIGGPVLRKKRSFKRHSVQNAKGKQRFFLEVINNGAGKQLYPTELEEADSSATRYSELAFHKRKRAQALMENADLATYKAAMALKIAQAAKDTSDSGNATSMILF